MHIIRCKCYLYRHIINHIYCTQSEADFVFSYDVGLQTTAVWQIQHP